MDTLLNDTKTDLPVPEKFFDKEKKEIRIDALLKSYLELEKKLAGLAAADKNDKGDAPLPTQIAQNLLNAPASPQDYQITINHAMFTQDDEINKRLHEKGYTNEQAQFLYDLAAEYMVPLVLDIAREFEAERQLDRLVEAFGGKERYAEVSRQLLAFGKKNLPADVLAGLATSYEGVMTLYRMMQSGKPLAIQNPEQAASMDETALRSMMRDPKYWRDKDPTFIKKVSDGFRQVFTDTAAN